MFRPEDQAEAKHLLIEHCGNSLPAFETENSDTLERIRFATLKLSRGDLEALRSAIEKATVDWRDLLAAADSA